MNSQSIVNRIEEHSQSVNVVYSTKKYDLFQFVSCNRKINENHVKELAIDIERRGMICPVIVNETFEIIEGQHRVKAAESRNLSVEYIVKPGLSVADHVSAVNSTQKSWTIEDYVHFGIEKNIGGFEIIEAIHKEFGGTYHTALFALTRNSDSNQVASHANSSEPFVISESDVVRAKEELKFINKNEKNFSLMGGGNSPRMAVMFAYSCVLDRKRLQHILDTSAQEIGEDSRRKNRPTIETCLQSITTVYNHRLSDKNKITSLVDAYNSTHSTSYSKLKKSREWSLNYGK